MLFLAVCLLTLCLQSHGADKYTDENRPYEFGFTIDGEQHRHEKKDENGLIMGEFGFITADGVYHVTVYATDENGNFKILSMKNIRVKPYPTSPGIKQGHSLKFPPTQGAQDTQPPPPPRPNNPIQPVKIEPPAKSCSHCSLPTTTTKRPELSDLAVISKDQSQFPPSYENNAQVPNYNHNDNIYNNQQQYPEQGDQNNVNYPHSDLDSNQYTPQRHLETPATLNNHQEGITGERNPKQFNQDNYYNPQQQFPSQQSFDPQDVSPHTRFSDSDQSNPYVSKPVLISAQMQIVDGNTDINHRGPGEREGLPQGLSRDDMSTLLYTFNYTVGFHGHHEEGYTNGAKKGYYFVTGRNGVRTRIDYVADETGFHPKISQEVLDLVSEDVPKPETEKDEKYGLKGYEFKWLYYPLNSKR